MNGSYITIQGWVGGEPDDRRAGDSQVASFRVGSTPRYMKQGTWTDGTTCWYTVQAWRQLGANVLESVHTGDAVIVYGRVRHDVWEPEGKPRSERWIIDATWIGHDLTKGTARFSKTARPVRDPREDQGVREMVHGYDVDGPQLDSTAGDPVHPAA